MRRLPAVWLVIAAVCSAPAAAEVPKGRDVDRGIGDVPLAPRPTQVAVADPWSDETRQRYYKWDGPPSDILHLTGILLFESPFPLVPLIAPLTDPFPDAEADRLAAQCKARFDATWDRIGCVSIAVKNYYRGAKFDGLRTYCRSHAMAFEKTFDALRIGRAHSEKKDASGPLEDGHVANLIIITNDLGVTFGYVIDSGWFPGTLFPMSDTAKRLHDRNGDGKTDFSDLPSISEKPHYATRPGPRSW